MSHKIKQLKRQANDIATQFNKGQFNSQNIVLIRDYVEVLEKSPITKDYVKRLYDLNEKEGPCFNSSEEFANIEMVEIKNGNLKHNAHIYFGFLKGLLPAIDWANSICKDLMQAKDENELMEKAKKADLQINEQLDYIQNNEIPCLYEDSFYKKMFNDFHNHIIDYLTAKEELARQEAPENLSFDEQSGIFYFDGREIPIKRQNKITNQHRIMKYIFVDNRDRLDDDFFYSEIAEDLGDDKETEKQKNWSKYRTAIKDLNSKISDDFFIFNSSKQGSLRINKKYFEGKI